LRVNKSDARLTAIFTRRGSSLENFEVAGGSATMP
jgi:hypothetical protein